MSGPQDPQRKLGCRQKRRLLACLFDYQRIASRRAEGIASDQELRTFESLSHRLGSPSTQATRDLIHDATTQLRAHEEEVKRNNFKAWRERLFTCSSEVSKWLKAKDHPYVNCVSTVGDDERVVRTSSVVEASLAIYNYWKEFWLRLDRTGPSLDRRTETLLATIEQPDQEVALPLPNGADLLAKAREGGGAGSPDGWTGGEIKHLPKEVFETFAALAKGWVENGAVPAQFCQSRMVCLPKPGGHVLNQTVPVDKLRPITVMSSWWRLWVSTLYHSDAFETWMRSVLAPEVGAITGEDIYATLIRIFEQLSQQGMVLALDFSKAFDCLDARVTTAMLQKYEWPPGLLKIFELVWLRLDRFIQFQQHARSVPLTGGVQPQGDPMGPSLWIQAGLKFVQRHAQAPASTVMHIDDCPCSRFTSSLLGLLE